MKKAILAVLAVLVMAGSAAAEVKDDVIKDHLDRGHHLAAVSVERCTCPPEDANAKNIVYLRAYWEASSKTINRDKPGSNMVCGGSTATGSIYEDAGEYHIASGRFVRWESKSKINGLSYELSAGNLIERVSDGSGNYIVFQYDRNNPRASRFIDAKLPISVQSNGAILANGKGLAVSTNELISGLNNAYNKLIPGGGEILYFSSSMLVFPSNREWFVKQLEVR